VAVLWGRAAVLPRDANDAAIPTCNSEPEATSRAPGEIGEFLEESWRVCRLRHLSIHAAVSYVWTIRSCIHFHDLSGIYTCGKPGLCATSQRNPSRSVK
jgi:hypothetical protein